MSREMCYRCFWPQSLCWCSSIHPIDTRTKFVILMHPKEYKQIKAATGRFTHLCLTNSKIYMGIGFDNHREVQALIRDPQYIPVLLYPGKEAINLSQEGISRTFPEKRTLLVFVLDATWRLAKKMFNSSVTLQKLQRLMFIPEFKSRYIIKKQPHDWCLSTIEAVHELLLALEKSGLDSYTDPAQMLDLFAKMQDFQVKCINDPDLKKRC